MPSRQPVVIIDNYDSFSYNLYQMIQLETDAPVEVYRNDALTFDELRAKNPQKVVLSPGPGNPANPEDFGVCADVIRRQPELNCPVLGVCLGHQGLAHYLGGKVVAAPEIVHGESRKMVAALDSLLFEGMPQPFEAMRYHSLLVEAESLPPSLRITAWDVEHGLPMAIEHIERPLFGIQFHPESIGTPQGRQILRNFLAQ
jgi:anthranilate synthase/aminodeoxychorismate synthase-like glutamine amidotransferase